MELRHLRYFVAVAEEMNIHRAAERLNISQPPLTVTIQQLEQELGVRLFSREGRGIQITRVGEFFLEEARQILKSVHDATVIVKEVAQGIRGGLNIGFISSSVTGILQNCIIKHRKLYPDIKLDLNQYSGNSIIKGVQNEELDIGIERLPIYLPNDLEQFPIIKESWFVAIPEKHKLAQKKQVTIKDLKDEKIIFYPRWNSPASYDSVMQLFSKNGFEPNIIQEATEQMTIAGLVASNMGIGIVPECMAKVKMPNVVHRPIAGTKNLTGFTLIYHKNEDLLVEQFMDLAKKIKF